MVHTRTHEGGEANGNMRRQLWARIIYEILFVKIKTYILFIPPIKLSLISKYVTFFLFLYNDVQTFIAHQFLEDYISLPICDLHIFLCPSQIEESWGFSFKATVSWVYTCCILEGRMLGPCTQRHWYPMGWIYF